MSRTVVIRSGLKGPKGDPGGVDSVNGEQGDVVLDYIDVDADPAGTANTVVNTHNADTTFVHGIDDTSVLLIGPLSGNPLEFYNGDGGFAVPGAGTIVADLDDLTDVTITAAASGDIIRHNGTAWVDAAGTTYFEVAGAVAAHEADTTAVHGITDTSLLETTAGATSKASAAQSAAISAAATDATTKASAAQSAAATDATSKASAAQSAAISAAATDATSKVATHTAATDPHADRAYTDAQITAALSSAYVYKAAVVAATTGNITLSGAQTIDGVSIVAGNRVLVKDQTTGSQDGIYDAASGAWTRATDADISAEVTAGMSVPVTSGTVGGGHVFLLTTPNPITLDTTALTFSLIGSGDVRAANNLSDLTSASQARTNLGLGTMATQAASAVAVTGGTVVGITDLTVADGGTGGSDAATARTNLGLGTMATQAASAVAITGGAVTGITDITVADGGTGSSTAAGARTNLGLVIGTDVQAAGAYTPSGTDVAVADGGTGSSTAAGARTNLGLVIGTDVSTPAALAAHEADTTAIHGITNTALLETTAGAQAKVDALSALYAPLPDDTPILDRTIIVTDTSPLTYGYGFAGPDATAADIGQVWTADGAGSAEWDDMSIDLHSAITATPQIGDYLVGSDTSAANVNAKFTLSSVLTLLATTAPLTIPYLAAADSSALVTVTANSTAHTYGSWVQLIASTTVDAGALTVQVSAVSGATVATATVISIGIGAAASEVELFKFACGSTSGGAVPAVPVSIPAGTRIAARIQSVVTGGKTAQVVVQTGIKNVFYPPKTTVDSLVVDLATSRGLNMPTDNTYVQVTASTARAYRALVVVPSGSSTVMSSEDSIYTIGIGAAASEVVQGTVSVSSSTSEIVSFSVTSPIRHGIIPGDIPSGSRIAVKQSIGRNYRDVTILGIPYP